MKIMSEALLQNLIAAVLKADKFAVTSAEFTPAGDGIKFEATSKSGQVRVKGLFCDPQGQLDLEEPDANVEAAETGEEPAANEGEDEDEPH